AARRCGRVRADPRSRHRSAEARAVHAAGRSPEPAGERGRGGDWRQACSRRVRPPPLARGRPVPEPHRIIDLALAPAVVLDRERVDAGIHADVANEEIGTLSQVSDRVLATIAETTCTNWHRPTPPCRPGGIFGANG